MSETEIKPNSENLTIKPAQAYVVGERLFVDQEDAKNYLQTRKVEDQMAEYIQELTEVNYAPRKLTMITNVLNDYLNWLETGNLPEPPASTKSKAKAKVKAAKEEDLNVEVIE